MRGKIENIFPQLHAGDALVDKTGEIWSVHSWSGMLQLNLIPPEEYRLKVMHVGLSFFGNEEDPCLICAESGSALGAFLGMTEIEVILVTTPAMGKEYLDPRCPESTICCDD